ncbi:MAG: N-acetylmuramoyl-L-alanine amidase [Paracoccaceae bacterium]
MDIATCPSPNFGDRKGGAVELIVLHYTAMADAASALERLCDPEAEVSAHYLIAKDGEITRLVHEDKRAWHAGNGSWAGLDDVNSRSIGIELDNDGASDFEEPLMASLEWLLADLLERHELEPKAVIAHSDMSPERKSDPGRLFDWQRLAAKGLSIWPDPAMGGDFMRNAAYVGYPTQLGESCVLDAFRQRFRPGASGPLSPADEAMMAGLARQHPADVTERIARRTPSRPLHSM